MPHGGYNVRARDRRHRRKRLWLPVERAYLEHALAVHVFFETETRDAAEVAPDARWLVAPTGFECPLTVGMGERVAIWPGSGDTTYARRVSTCSSMR